MKPKFQRKHSAAIIAIAVSAILVFAFVPQLFQSTEAEKPSDTGLAAAISFKPQSIAAASLTNYPKADFFSVAPFPFQQTPATFSVTTTDGSNVDNSDMIVEIKGKIITGGGVPVKDYSLTGTTQIKVDNTVFKTSQLSLSGTGAIPNPVVVKIDGSPELSIPVSALEQAWGSYNYGDHVIVISVSATLTVSFVDGEQLSKTFQNANIGSVKLKSSSDASIEAFEIESNYNNAGTTTEPLPEPEPEPEPNPDPDPTTTQPPPPPPPPPPQSEPEPVQVTDTWATSGSQLAFGTGPNYEYEMRIDDPARRGVILKEVSFTLYIPGSGFTNQAVYVTLLNENRQQIATTPYIMSNSFNSTPKSYTFTFPSGTKTPNSSFYIKIHSSEGTATRMSTDGPYPKGTAYSYNRYSGSLTALPGDLVGSAVYIIYQ